MKIFYSILTIALLFAVQLQAQNSFRWARGFGGAESDYLYDLATDASGNTYTCGNYSTKTDLDPDSSVSLIKNAKGSSDIFISKIDPNGNLVWAHRIGGKYGDMALGIALDASSNVFVCGYFTDTVDFNPDSTAVVNLISASAMPPDAFVLKLSSSGAFINAVGFGGTLEDQCFDIATDKTGQVYVCGIFRGSADFNPGTGLDLHVSNAGSYDAFAIKFDNNLGFIKAISWGGNNYDFAKSICTDNKSNPIIAGRYTLTADMNPGTGVYNLSSKGGFDGFILKTDTAMNFNWAKSLGGTGSEYIYAIAADPNDNVLLTGTFESLCDFNPDPNTNHFLKASGFEDVFVCKLNSAGNYNWAHKFGKTSFNYGRNISSDANGNIYISGGFRDSVDFNPDTALTKILISSGGTDAFLLSLNPGGGLRWVKKAGGPLEDLAFAHAISGGNELYFAGTYESNCNFQTDTGTFLYINYGQIDAFVVKLQMPVSNLNDPKIADGILLYPNPANDKVTLETQGTTATSAELYHFNGLKIADFIHEDKRLYINTSGIEPSVYIIRISTIHGEVYKKLLIAH